MGFQSQEGQVGFRTQAEEGTYADPGDGGVFMRLRSGALGPNRELLIPDPEIGGNRDVPDAYLGAVAWTGEHEFYARTRSIATLLKGVLGGVASEAEGVEGAHKHTFVPASGALPWLSVEEAIGEGYDVFQYIDAKVNTFHLEAEANGYLMGSVGLIARTQTAGHTRTANPAVDVNPMFVGTNIFARYAGVTLPAKSFTFDITNNLEDDDFRLGSLELGDITEKRREFTAGLTVRPEDSDLWRQAVYGQSAATQAGGIVTKDIFEIVAETYELIGASAIPHQVVIEAPMAALQPFGLEPSGDDVIEHDVEIQFLRPDPAVDIVTIDVFNDQEAVA